MCKLVRSKNWAAMACSCVGLVSAAILSALVWTGCGGGDGSGNPGGTTEKTEYVLTINLDPVDYSNRVGRGPGNTLHYDRSTVTLSAGDTVTLTAIAGFKQKFVRWEWEGGAIDTVNPIVFKMDNAKSLTARFSEIYTLTITRNPTNGGTVSYDSSRTPYVAGDTVTVTAVAASGFSFTGWSGASAATTNPVTITVNRDDTLTANFEWNPITDSCTANPSLFGCPGYCVANPTAQGCTPPDTCAANPKPGCPNYCTVNPTVQGCPGYCAANPSAPECTPPDTCTTNPKPGCPNYCSANPTAQGCPGYCTANPTAPGCVTDPCATDPTPDCSNYCTVNPTAPECVPPDPCVGGPTAECCVANPDYPGCTIVDPCATNPTPDCSNYCVVYPTAHGCSGYCGANPDDPECDPCNTDPTPNCPNYCDVYPNAAQCQDPCTGGVSTACCNANPNYSGCKDFMCGLNPSAVGCEAYLCGQDLYADGCITHCTAHPTAPECTGFDPCVANPSAYGCPGYCTANPTAPGCSTTEKKYCYWAPNSYNTYKGACVEIGDAHCDPGASCTEAECVGASGAVKTTSNCDGLPITGDPCDGGPTAACCAAVPDYAGCPTNKKYCYWAPNSYNSYTGACVEIGGQYCEEASCATETGCTAASGAVKTTSDCDGLPLTGTDPDDPCIANPSAAGCGTGGTDKYCRFGGSSTQCWKIPTASQATPAECWADYGEVVDSCSQATIGVYCRWGTGGTASCDFTLGYVDGYESGAAHCTATSGTVVASCP